MSNNQWKRHAAKLAWSLAIGLVACTGDKGVAPSLQSPSVTLGTARVAPANAIMAVGQTLQLTVTGQALTGEPITEFDSVQYLLSNPADTVSVRFSPDGQLTAISPSGQGQPVIVNVVPFKNGVVKGDQAIVQVTATAIPGATLSIHPIPPDSAKLANGEYKTIIPLIQNPATGETVDNPVIRLRVNAADINQLGFYAPAFSTATISYYQLYQYDCQVCVGLDQITAVGNSGTAWLYADVNVYGTMLHDSVQYTLTNSYIANLYITDYVLTILSNPRVVIAPGGTVTFNNYINGKYGTVVSYAFDNPSAALTADPPSDLGGASGNVSGLMYGESSVRIFRTPGTYTWTATVSGSGPPFAGLTATGVIVVQ